MTGTASVSSKPPKWVRVILKRVRRHKHPQDFLRRTRGVIHVGANIGQERERYHRNGVAVLWIEPIPEVFARLEANLRPYPHQRAIQALITDRDGVRHTLHVASNDGMSSSIFDLHLHRDIWPDIGYTSEIELHSVTLPTAIRCAGVDVESYDALVLDTQGSELLVLRGAVCLLSHMRYVLVEAADFQAYAGGCLLADVAQFMREQGFRETRRYLAARHPAGGRYYDVLFVRRRRWGSSPARVPRRM